MIMTMIKKDTGLEDVFSGYDATQPEQHSSIEVLSSGNLENAIKLYGKYIHAEKTEKYRYLPNFALTPNELEDLNQMLITYPLELYPDGAGIFLSKCIQQSYQKGEKDFSFVMNELKMNHFASIITPDENDFININIIGDPGYFAAYDSKNLNFNIDGYVSDYFGFQSVNINVIINGDVKEEFGNNAFNMRAFINGSTSSRFGVSTKHSSFFIDGNVCKDGLIFSRECLAIINGDVGMSFGSESTGSISIIKGSSELSLLNGSSFSKAIVKGSIDGTVLSYSSNSSLYVKGDLNGKIGSEIHDGNIVVQGSFPDKDNYVAKDKRFKPPKIVTGKEAKDDPLYATILQEIYQRLKK